MGSRLFDHDARYVIIGGRDPVKFMQEGSAFDARHRYLGACDKTGKLKNKPAPVRPTPTLNKPAPRPKRAKPESEVDAQVDVELKGDAADVKVEVDTGS